MGSLVHLACHSGPICLPAGLLVLRGAPRIPLPACAVAGAQWPGPLPAPDEQVGFMALVAPPQRHGHGPDHGRHHPPARIRGLHFLAYYPTLALFVLVFSSLWLGLAWATMIAAVYTIVCLTVGLGLDYVAGDEKVLLARLAVMYALVLCVSLVVRFERTRRQAAVERERELQRERIELSQAIHDTAAQTAFMIGLGIDAAKQVAGDSNEELTARLDATSRLSKTAVWQLRHPIDMGRIFEGSELGWTLDSHVATFRTITSVSAELTQNGVEPPLSIEARSQLFSIAHNALANAFRHAGASRVLVELDFGRDELRLSVSDDGVGLPDDYEERGHGFENMRAYAGRLGGRLIVEPTGPVGGASVTCVMPLARGEQEG